MLGQAGVSWMDPEPWPTQGNATANRFAGLVLSATAVPQDFLAIRLVGRDVGTLQIQRSALPLILHVDTSLPAATGDKLEVTWASKFSVQFRDIRGNMGIRHNRLSAN
jgi:hypothetical protein